ncbi:MAG TPA: helix-turn-helix domain-containing protein [Sphingobium sp.]
MDGPLHPEEIKARLRMRYGTLKSFAETKGFEAQAVTRVLAGIPWLVPAQAIADELGIPLHRVSSYYYRKIVSDPIRRKRSIAHRLNAGAR